jgi:hypothetical protein
MLVTKGWRATFCVKDRPLPPKVLMSDEWGKHRQANYKLSFMILLTKTSALLVRYVHLPGLKMHYVENGDKKKPLMVFVHGFPEFWFSWRHQLKYFAKDYWYDNN